MVDPPVAWRVVRDAARLIREGELYVFGSAALAFWLGEAPHSRDVDLWAVPAERGQLIESMMGELSWYHEKFSIHAEVWGPETFKAPSQWRARAKRFSFDDAPNVQVFCAHPHDVVLSKLERLDPKDQDHVRAVLAQLPLTSARLDELLAEFTEPRDPEREARFQANLAWLRRQLSA